MRMSFQSASSSSATICASAVPTPWPISAFVMCTVTSPSCVMVSAAFGSYAAAPSAAPGPTSGKRMVSAAPAAAADPRNARRVTGVLMTAPPARRA